MISERVAIKFPFLALLLLKKGSYMQGSQFWFDLKLGR